MSSMKHWAKQKRTIKVLVGAALLLISCLSLWEIVRHQNTELEKAVDKRLEKISADYWASLNQQANGLTHYITKLQQQLAAAPKLEQQRILANKNELAQANGYKIDTVELVNPHQTKTHQHKSRNKSEQPLAIHRDGAPEVPWHLEMNKSGEVLISVRKAWPQDQQPQTYLQVAQSIHHTLKKVGTQQNSFSVMTDISHPSTLTLLYSDFEEIPGTIKQVINDIKPSTTTISFEYNSERYKASVFNFYDNQQHPTISHIIAYNYQQNVNDYQTVIFLALLMIVASAAYLFNTVLNYLRHTEQDLKTTYQRLLNEVEIRKDAEDRLTQSKYSLEKRIGDRTRLLKHLNLQLENDLSERHKIEKALITSEQRYRHLFDYSSDAMILLEAGKPNRYNSQALQLLKITNEQHHQDLSLDQIFKQHQNTPDATDHFRQTVNNLDKTEPYKFERCCQDLQGGEFYAEITLSKIETGKQESLLHVTIRNITEKKDSERKIRNQAYQDSLTGLPNRNLFVDRLNQAIAFASRNECYGAVLFLDLDNFKYINDSLGHAMGDSLLIQVAQRIKGAVRAQDTIARFGGDEFVVLIPASFNSIQPATYKVRRIAEKIRAVISHPFMLEDKEFHITPSIGASIFPENSSDLEDILKHADTAMYQAKNSGKNAICFFETSMQEAIDKRLDMERKMRIALREQKFILHYQPKIDIHGNIIGAEALCRWQAENGSWLSPAEFIPIAEDSGIITELGNWVMTTAIKTLRQIQSRYAPNFSMAVNVSPIQLNQSNVVEQLIELCTRLKVKPSTVTLEITENFLLQDSTDGESKLHRIKAHGFRISIDDFGTGYSSLSYLKHLSIDELKIDRSFVADIEKHIDNAAIVETIIAMSKHLKLDVVAEGVENEVQLEFLRKHGCGRYQGYYFSKALSNQDLFTFIQENRFAITPSTENPMLSGVW